MVKELIAAGIKEPTLTKMVMEFHGVDRLTAQEIIQIETSDGEPTPPDLVLET